MQNLIKDEIKKVKLTTNELSYINNLLNFVAEAIRRKIKKYGIDASVFVGGSLAKNTLVKGNGYDVDLFLRFDKKYSEEEIKKNMKRIFFWFKIPSLKSKLKKVHGSRDYYQILLKNHKVIFEVIPTLKILDPKEARNITDLSYFHVNYIKKKLAKNKKLTDHILLAKSFSHAQKSYGAESYIKGFSGYALELLILEFKDFIKFLNEIVKSKEKIVIDPEKHYKDKNEIFAKLNSSKILSPIVIVDPTFKERNAASALSYETFEKFKVAAENFLKNPDQSFFYNKGINIEKMRKTAKEFKGILAVFEIKTHKQPGDIAGTKMLKFSNLLSKEISRYYEIIEKEFEYSGGKYSRVYYILKRKKEIIIQGPSIYFESAVKRFKEKHKIWYIEDGRIKSARRTDIKINEFLKELKKRHKKTMRDMGIKKVKII